MDVTELLHVSSNYTMTISLIFLGVGLMLAGVVLAKVVDSSLPFWVLIPGLVLVMAGCLCGASIADSSKQESSALLQSILFEGYGFNIDRAADHWDEIANAGEAGLVTKVSREGVEQDVRIRLEGNRLVITGPDGQEILTNAQRVAESSS